MLVSEITTISRYLTAKNLRLASGQTDIYINNFSTATIYTFCYSSSFYYTVIIYPEDSPLYMTFFSRTESLPLHYSRILKNFPVIITCIIFVYTTSHTHVNMQCIEHIYANNIPFQHRNTSCVYRAF